MDNWFVKLHRKLLENPIASNPLLIWLFCYLLLLVSHKDHIFYFWKIKIEQKKWEAIISKKDIAKSFWISRWTLDSYLNILESEQVISIKTTTKYTVLTIINRCKYQTTDIKLASTWTSTWHQLEHQPDTINNDNNDNNEKNNKYIYMFDDFWKLYPKKKWKAKAEIKYKEVIRWWAKHEDIIKWVQGYINEIRSKNIQDEYIKRPQWRLSEKRRIDDYEEAQTRRNNFIPL